MPREASMNSLERSQAVSTQQRSDSSALEITSGFKISLPKEDTQWQRQMTHSMG